jgi:hypothetical protein
LKKVLDMSFLGDKAEGSKHTQGSQSKIEMQKKNFFVYMGGGISNEAIKAETGCEALSSRWHNLQLGYCRRLFEAKPERILRVVAEFRRAERVASGGVGFGSRGRMRAVEGNLRAHGLQRYWDSPIAMTALGPSSWKLTVYDAVDERGDRALHNAMFSLSSLANYVYIKDWGPTAKSDAVFSSEEERLGFLTSEHYLGDRTDLKGTRLKMLCRLNFLQVLDRAGRETKPPWPRNQRVCCMCDTGLIEDVRHFIMDCPAYAPKRAKLLDRVRTLMDSAGARAFQDMGEEEKFYTILGKRFGDRKREDQVDRAVRRFLSKCWNAREPATATLDAALGIESSHWKRNARVNYRFTLCRFDGVMMTPGSLGPLAATSALSFAVPILRLSRLASLSAGWAFSDNKYFIEAKKTFL